MANMLSPLATPAATRDVLEEHGLSTKHALGQNFLVNDAILQKIVELAQLDAFDDVLEVGPGIGTLTIALLKCAGRVVSVERDADLPAVLEDTLEPWADRFALISKDALELTEEEVRLALTKCAAPSEGEGCASRAVPHDANSPVDCSPKQDCLSTEVISAAQNGGIRQCFKAKLTYLLATFALAHAELTAARGLVAFAGPMGAYVSPALRCTSGKNRRSAARTGRARCSSRGARFAASTARTPSLPTARRGLRYRLSV